MSLIVVVWAAIQGNIGLISFNDVVFNILTVFVLIDLFKTFIDYREHERIRLIYITDATILLVMREIAAGVYAQRIEYEFILSLAALLLVLGAIMIVAVKYPSDDMDVDDLTA